MKQVAEFQIHDTFKITGVGLVFAGIVLTGELRSGDFIRFDFNGVILKCKIKGVHLMRVTDAKPNAGMAIESLNNQEIDDLRSWKPNQVMAEIYAKPDFTNS